MPNACQTISDKECEGEGVSAVTKPHLQLQLRKTNYLIIRCEKAVGVEMAAHLAAEKWAGHAQDETIKPSMAIVDQCGWAQKNY